MASLRRAIVRAGTDLLHCQSLLSVLTLIAGICALVAGVLCGATWQMRLGTVVGLACGYYAVGAFLIAASALVTDRQFVFTLLLSLGILEFLLGDRAIAIAYSTDSAASRMRQKFCLSLWVVLALAGYLLWEHLDSDTSWNQIVAILPILLCILAVAQSLQKPSEWLTERVLGLRKSAGKWLLPMYVLLGLSRTTSFIPTLQSLEPAVMFAGAACLLLAGTAAFRFR